MQTKVTNLNSEFNQTINRVHDRFTHLVETLDEVRNDYIDMLWCHYQNAEFLHLLEHAMVLSGSNEHISVYNLLNREINILKTSWQAMPVDEKVISLNTLQQYAEKFENEEETIKRMHHRMKHLTSQLPKSTRRPKRDVFIVP